MNSIGTTDFGQLSDLFGQKIAVSVGRSKFSGTLICADNGVGFADLAEHLGSGGVQQVIVR